jgi:prepilin-type N-terminal cleavage/methylation domain-containing protein
MVPLRTDALKSRVPGAPSKAGFTLVEAMIVILLLAVIGTAAMGIFIGNARFYAWSRDVVAARQNLRGTIDLLATEIRQASAGDFLVAEHDSLALRFDVSRAVVCDSTSVDRIALVVFDSVRAPNVPSSFRGTAVSEPYDSIFTLLDGWTAALKTKGAGPRSICEGNGTALNVSSSRYREMAGWRARYGRAPGKGAIIRTYGKLTFGLSASSFAPGLAARRNGQEVAAPFDSASGFSYLLADGAELTSVKPARLRDIAAVRIRLIAAPPKGPSRVGSSRSESTDHVIFLRN